jgi:hypothetical protein
MIVLEVAKLLSRYYWAGSSSSYFLCECDLDMYLNVVENIYLSYSIEGGINYG